MLIQDWMPPYGEGKHEDIKLSIQKEHHILRAGDLDHPFIQIKITFIDEGGGLEEMPNNLLIPESQFPYPYDAPMSLYAKNIFTADTYIKKTIFSTPNANFFFRIRPKYDGQGNMINALYGMVSGKNGKMETSGGKFWSAVDLNYFINPTPNDRNLEPARDENGRLIPYNGPLPE